MESNTEMKALKKQMRLIISTVLNNIRIIIVFGFIGFFVSMLGTLIPIDNMYQANSAVCSTLFSDNYDNTKSVRLLAAFMDLFDSSLIQDKIVAAAGNSISRAELAGMTTLRQSTSRTILTINTRHKDPAIAIKTANAIAHVLIIETDRLFDSPSGIKVLDKATDAGYAYRAIRIYILICFLSTFLSAFGCCIYFIAKTLTSDKILFIEDCTMDGSMEIMGVIPYSIKKQTKERT